MSGLDNTQDSIKRFGKRLVKSWTRSGLQEVMNEELDRRFGLDPGEEFVEASAGYFDIDVSAGRQILAGAGGYQVRGVRVSAGYTSHDRLIVASHEKGNPPIHITRSDNPVVRFVKEDKTKQQGPSGARESSKIIEIETAARKFRLLLPASGADLILRWASNPPT